MRRPPLGYPPRARGPLDFKSRLHREEGNIMPLARKPVISAPLTMRIKDAVELMVREGIRRLPIASPGTKRLEGIITTRDVLNFLGGGEKFMIIQKRFGGNFLAAINEPVRTIMSERVVHGDSGMSISEVAKLLLHTGVGGAPIVDSQGQIVGMISERDFIRYIPSTTGVPVSYHMTRHVITAEPELQIREAARRMVQRGIRRLPVLRDRELVGIITSVDILRYFGTGEMFRYMASGRVEESMQRGVDTIMTREVFTVTPETDLGEVAGVMRDRGCGGLPVLDGEELAGIITEHDLLELLV